ncbi:MAG: response regulator transcription factor [Oscillospiraceae bacterium]|jgi:DNA-binding response OmpR family regulator|nr:response regulator transcription factor [Oscillospiraceae bacterium]
MKILVVDDEITLVKGIKFNLESEGYQVDAAHDGAAAVSLAATGDYDLILLDVMMPNLSGLDACMRIREFSNVPIIMLTARSEDIDKIIGFESGADDYLTKPFNVLELKARIRALLRRANRTLSTAENGGAPIAVGELTIDPASRNVRRGKTEIDLTAREFDLFELLAKNPGRVYSRENLLNIVWGRDYQGDVRTVDVHVRRLREKLERNPAEPVILLTKWGVGYYIKG